MSSSFWLCNPCISCLFGEDEEPEVTRSNPTEAQKRRPREARPATAAPALPLVLPQAPETTVAAPSSGVAVSAEQDVATESERKSAGNDAANSADVATRASDDSFASPERTPPVEDEQELAVETFVPGNSSEAETLRFELKLADPGASLAQLLSTVEELGNVNVAFEVEQRRMYAAKDKRAEMRTTVMDKVMAVMGERGPGLKVKKFHRTGGKGEKGKWSARVLHFVPASPENGGGGGGSSGGGGGSSGGGGGVCLTWGAKRLFAKERSMVDVADVEKVEVNGKMLWVTTTQDGRIAFEMRRSLDATLLCHCIEYMMEDIHGPSEYEESDSNMGHGDSPGTLNTAEASSFSLKRENTSALSSDDETTRAPTPAPAPTR